LGSGSPTPKTCSGFLCWRMPKRAKRGIASYRVEMTCMLLELIARHISFPETATWSAELAINHVFLVVGCGQWQSARTAFGSGLRISSPRPTTESHLFARPMLRGSPASQPARLRWREGRSDVTADWFWVRECSTFSDRQASAGR